MTLPKLHLLKSALTEALLTAIKNNDQEVIKAISVDLEMLEKMCSKYSQIMN